MTKMEREIREAPGLVEANLNKYAAALAPAVAAVKARRLGFAVFAGRGSSDNAGIYFKYLAETLAGLPVALAAPSVVTVYGRSVALGDALVLGVSQSGQAVDVALYLAEATRQGAVTVAFTNDAESPVARSARHHVDLATGPEESVAATKTFTAELAALGLFAAMIADDHAYIEGLSTVPALLSEVIRSAEAIGVAAAAFRDVTSCFVLGRGYQLAVAHELALKLQETSYVRAHSHSFPDFQHGPFALAEKDAAFLLLAPAGPTMADAIAMAERLLAVDADVTAFTDDPAFPATRRILLPTAPETLQPLAFAVASQIFACRLAAEKRRDPDKPRGLRKVTVTR